LSEPEYEFVGTRPELRNIEFNAFSLVAEGTENGNILFEKESETSNAAVHNRTGKKGT